MGCILPTQFLLPLLLLLPVPPPPPPPPPPLPLPPLLLPPSLMDFFVFICYHAGAGAQSTCPYPTLPFYVPTPRLFIWLYSFCPHMSDQFLYMYFYFLIYLLNYLCACHGTLVEVRGQLAEAGSLLPQLGSWECNLGH